ncbi:translation initiation factor IF-5A [Candidatus Marsarchaeota G2 archaeon ECH_B_SAG-F08]|jgi:translation initiation factor 5A|uniref:Translation initiation factor 5A n=6 Tax=Candidatus Marsarchaeota TaxID=1978152 RepID=A0A2R6AHV3_9ARCH|nr:MAG: translation initiation factor IF-5A [Candidatus Marsarchaeota G1 archaeon OSP_D]PSN85964.1 MAG: translation initiation factor IF-5A [Candidatus Marsarchaeota G1 archaeon BE_D]PSN88453.1 MAG: translation initiation factor IF-5A [Candidatus Marsarchaeota G1 archaeon OSP_C]PSN89898.1 MAG: translation initiation factor IF-5A [Candidatus Marsarchaeota G1 archaeon OSP_B]PSN98085.1 MAG: translation initiation factor IF-5A [Candidatus Marsarchaeota G2 archaeon ECH_B_SAG-F08]PSO04826.1 MAG: tra
MSKPVEIGDLKEGGYCIIDGEPCRIVSIEKSKPGKHGSAKARIVAIGVFDGTKRSIVSPVDARIDVPIIEKRTGQLIAALGNNTYQVMDLQSFETFEASVDEEVSGQLKQGDEVEYWVILGRRKIMRKK